MRFLANENFPGSAVQALRDAGHDVVWVRSNAPGLPDRDVLQWAIREQRLLVTFDHDFGELARRTKLPKACGILLLRIPMPPAGETGHRIAKIIAARDDWAGSFSVIEPGRIRMRPLAPA